MNFISTIMGLLAFVIATPGFATQSATVFQLQEALESRITPIVRALDDKAIVYVRLSQKAEDLPLPLTPFVLKDSPIEGSNEDLQFSRLEINILTAKPSFPLSVITVVKEVAGGLGIAPVVHLRSLPTELSGTPLPHVSPNPSPSSVPSVQKGFWQNWRAYAEGKPWVYLAGAAVIVIAGCALLMALLIFVGARRVGGTLEKGSQRLAEAFSESRATPTAAPSYGAVNSDSDRVAFNDTQNLFAELPQESLLAVLSDCYWSEMDAYAAFIWRRIPVSTRKALLGQCAFLSEYTYSLQDVSELDLREAETPYYLEPLAIQHLNNAALTDLVKKTPTLYFELPSLRLAGLTLSSSERIQLVRTAVKGETVSLPDFSKCKASPHRVLKRRLNIVIKSVQEEQEVLALGDLTLEFMEGIPSLGWLTRLPQSEQAKLLNRYSARDLASAWIGPEEVLKELGSVLSPAKLRLVQSYVEQFPASRKSPVFQNLHEAAILALKQAQVATNEQKSLSNTVGKAA